jgi:broad specificity phosphatase PhoE
VAKTITLIRHAQTNANRDHMWQGTLDTGLSPEGIAQLDLLANRFAGRRPDVVLSSDLDRARRTASTISDTVVTDRQWREFGVGSWEGKTTSQIMAEYPEQMGTFLAGEDVAPGGGELMSVFGERIVAAFWDLAERMSEGDHAHVVTHGGAIWALLSYVLGRKGLATAMTVTSNTALTEITVSDDGTPQLTMFNDATHLVEPSVQFMPDGRTVTLFRHGQSEGNIAGRWQGRTDSPLTDTGRRQASQASVHAPRVPKMYTSPLRRAMTTAEIIGTSIGVEPVPTEGLMEMAFGSWEDLTYEEAAANDPELFTRVFVDEIDLPRGGTGETFAAAGSRISRTISSLVGESGGDLGVVSHGAAIRAYVVDILGLSFAERNRIPVARNTSMTSVLYAGDRTMLSSYNVAPHMSL